MIYLPGLILALAAFWFALSGETSPLFLMLGALSVLLTLWLVARLKIIDRDAAPYHRAPQMVIYGVWLVGEIVKANIAVIRRIVGPTHAIDPAMGHRDYGRCRDCGHGRRSAAVESIGIEFRDGRRHQRQTVGGGAVFRQHQRRQGARLDADRHHRDGGDRPLAVQRH